MATVPRRRTKFREWSDWRNSSALPGGRGAHAMEDDSDKPNYDVGYGRPPRKTQYTKGQSGNPKGRPKGSKSLKTLIQEELEEPITIFVKGKKKKITKARALVRNAIHLALTQNDPKMLTAMGAFKEDVAAHSAFPNGVPGDFTLYFENEPRGQFVNGEWILFERAQPWDDDPS